MMCEKGVLIGHKVSGVEFVLTDGESFNRYSKLKSVFNLFFFFFPVFLYLIMHKVVNILIFFFSIHKTIFVLKLTLSLYMVLIMK